MAARLIALALAGCLIAAVPNDRVSARTTGAPAPQVALDGVLAAYVGGDAGAIARTFRTPRDFQDKLHITEPRELQRWLGSWDPGKAVLLLEMARAATSVAPQYPVVLVRAGRQYLTEARAGNPASGAPPEFARLWHRTAVGVLQGVGLTLPVEGYADALDGRSRRLPSAAPPDARLVLARAVAQERRCWEQRPSLDHAGARIDALVREANLPAEIDTSSPTRSERNASVKSHAACLREAMARFESAAALEETKAEALVRGGWVLFQADRHGDALDRLDRAVPDRDDRDLQYWHLLFRGRVLSALSRPRDAVTAYRDALATCPNAQSAGIGLALELLRLNRDAEADAVARAVRAAGPAAPDPWSTYLRADHRFVDRWMDQLRRAMR